MSGFEVVGVVLGAIPLIISALENYKTTSQRVKYFRHKEPFVNRLIQALNEQRYFVEADLFLTLTNATDLETKEIDDLIHQPCAALFQDQEITDALSQYLGDGYGPYTNALARCELALGSIAKNIGGLSSGSQLNDSTLAAILRAVPRNNGRYEFYKKIKFSLQKEELDQHINELDNSTERLRRLRDASVAKQEVTFHSTSRKIEKLTTALHVVQDHASRLHSAISLGYVGGCHPEHKIQLYLENRSALLERTAFKSLKKHSIAFTIDFSPAPGPSTRGKLCYKAEVKVLEDEDSYCSDMRLQPPQQVQTKSVTINLPGSPDPLPEEIEDLCRSILTARESKITLDMYLSRYGNLRCYQLPASEERMINITSPSDEGILTLEEVLCNTRAPAVIMPNWTVNQRVALAFNIASSVIQLHSTPWLSDHWTKKSICFIRKGSMTQSQQRQTAPQPFITHKFTADSRRQNMTNCTNRTAKRSILELGILLLEVWHAKTLETHIAESSLPLNACSASFGTRYEAARHWLDDDPYYIPDFYLDAVTRCIECTLATARATPDWGDAVFRRSVCEFVLQPLWEGCPKEFRR